MGAALTATMCSDFITALLFFLGFGTWGKMRMYPSECIVVVSIFSDLLGPLCKRHEIVNSSYVADKEEEIMNVL